MRLLLPVFRSRCRLSVKRDLVRTLGKRTPARMTADPLEIAPSVTVDLPTLVGADLGEKAARYQEAREDLIAIDPEIMGGTPVIRGTRMTVYSVLGKLDGGDTVEDILSDHPHLSREAIETAALYARTHPLVGRPGGRPWAQAA